MTDEIKASFTCPNCGPISIRVEDETNDDSAVTCASCGVRFGTWGEVKAKVTDAAAAEVRARLRGAFSGLKGWKIT
ncbi:MAG: hypothetical protein QM647_15255 [Asticcacaulis sp.]|uniref:ECs_2282 family putative zinc-binding protein n=1 Tax=Asticcacaulis sp. TaxID=1872648 RepID=UPI0039E6796F